MELNELLNDINPEELEPRLELQILADPLSAAFTSSTPVNNCNGCNINQS